MKTTLWITLVAVFFVATIGLGSAALVENRRCVGNGCEKCHVDITDQCGDGKCNAEIGENCDTCAIDCGACVLCPAKKCGNGVCELSESGCDCPQDCGCCLDGLCLGSETYKNCQSDCAAAIRGKVVNYFDGSAVVGANVTCGPYKGNLSSIISDKSGNFFFPNVAPGFYECFASFQTSVSTLTTFSVFPGSNRFANKTEVITLDVETGILTGSTFYKAQNLALGGVKVVCRNQFNRRETFSDSSSRFFFTGIRPGLYQCEGSAAGYSPVTSLVLVTQAAVTTVDVFVDVLRGNIAGTIVNSRTGLNVESTVTCISNNETFTSNTTGGFFYFQNVYPTKAQCYAFPIGSGWIGNTAVGTVPPGLNLTLNINVTQVLSNLSGIVVNKDTGSPIRYADVTCTAPGYLVIALTKADGTFNFTNLAAASYSCEVRRGGFGSVTVTDVTLSTNAVLRLPAVGLVALPGAVTILLSSTRTSLQISGDLNCTNAAGAVVYSGPINGSVSISSVLPGTFTCSASSPTFVSTTSTRSIPPLVPVYFSIQLEPQFGSISGKVIDALVGITVSGATIACANINPVIPAFYSATSDGAGRFVFPKVFLDTYACVVQTISYSNNAFNVTVGTQGQNVDASFNLQPIPASILGQVVENGTQNFLAGAGVNCTFYGGPAVYLLSNTTDRGTFAFNDLMSFGPWRCVITTPGYSHANGRDFDSVITTRGATTQIKILMQPAPGSAQIKVAEAKTSGSFVLPFAKVFCRPVGGDDSSVFRVYLDSTGVGTFTSQRGNFFCTSKLDPGYVGASSATFGIVPGGLTPVLIEMAPIPGTLELLVIDSANALVKVAGARVFCGNVLVLTDPQGHATVPGLPRGTANCTIAATGYADLAFSANILNGLPTPLTISMRKLKRR